MTLPAWLGAGLRGAAAGYLTERCTISAQAVVTNELGGSARVPRLVAADVPCRVITTGQKTGASSTVVAGQETLAQEYELQVGPEVALAVDQEVTVGGETYQIVRLETALTERFFRSAVLVKR